MAKVSVKTKFLLILATVYAKIKSIKRSEKWNFNIMP